MKKVAFLTIDDMTEFESDDALMYDPLTELGIELEEVPWREKRNWNDYEMIVIRTTWDYQSAPKDFLKKLKQIEASGGNLLCPSSVVEWNMHKSYLKNLEREGVAIVPSIFGKKLTEKVFDKAATAFEANKFIVKPTVGANSDNTFIMHADKLEEEALVHFSDKEFIVQPYINSINTHGVYSLIYFNNVYSHALVKVPAKEDFRVQEEHGGRVIGFKANPEMLEMAQKAIEFVKEDVLFTRVDLVQMKDGSYAVMEVELIEPSLYLRMDPKAPRTFAKAILGRISNN